MNDHFEAKRLVSTEHQIHSKPIKMLVLLKDPHYDWQTQNRCDPFTSEKRLSGHYHTTFKKLVIHRRWKKFYNCYRMSYSSFQELLLMVKPELTRQNTAMRSCISAEERLLITLRYLATENDNNMNNALDGTTVREMFKDYFNSDEGSIPWQNDIVNRH
ncbi:hypothetical protein HW555_008183 [Spodoptera exigua]|uniref:Uncharacterized protein n=1 Tax=Spodoptera exigua TaxID=7107 RepID=A0A835GDP5_SPOEX|nr:hypothetical protein HW555_008183 [Spodoptera exigua]